MQVSPAKHSYAWLPRKCNYWTDIQTDGQTDAGQSDPYVPLCFAGDTKTRQGFKSRSKGKNLCLITGNTLLKYESIFIWSCKQLSMWNTKTLPHFNDLTMTNISQSRSDCCYKSQHQTRLGSYSRPFDTEIDMSRSNNRWQIKLTCVCETRVCKTWMPPRQLSHNSYILTSPYAPLIEAWNVSEVWGTHRWTYSPSLVYVSSLKL